MEYKEITGNLITLALEGEFDVIAHGCNSFCNMGAGIAPQMAKAFGADRFPMEDDKYKGKINKLGCIDYKGFEIVDGKANLLLNGSDNVDLYVVNMYSQYHYGRNHSDGVTMPIDYEALTLGLRKMNHEFKGKHIGLPLIGCGLAGGDWDVVKVMFQNELKDCKVTVVHYDG